MQLEFRYLSYHTGDSSFREKAERVYNALRNKGSDGIFPTKVRGPSPLLLSPSRLSVADVTWH